MLLQRNHCLAWLDLLLWMLWRLLSTIWPCRHCLWLFSYQWHIEAMLTITKFSGNSYGFIDSYAENLIKPDAAFFKHWKSGTSCLVFYFTFLSFSFWVSEFWSQGEGKGKFKLVISASWCLVPSQLWYPLGLVFYVTWFMMETVCSCRSFIHKP